LAIIPPYDIIYNRLCTGIEAVVDQKRKEAYVSQRKISRFSRKDDLFVSPSSCYQILKSLSWIEPQELRNPLGKILL
jgi:hypothetical protein